MGFSLPDPFQLHGDLCLNVQFLNHSRSVRQRPCYSILTECFSEACLAKTTTWNKAHLPSKLMVVYSRLNLSSNVILEMRLLQINVHEASSSSTTMERTHPALALHVALHWTSNTPCFLVRAFQEPSIGADILFCRTLGTAHAQHWSLGFPAKAAAPW